MKASTFFQENLLIFKVALLYRDSSENFNLYTSKTPRNIGYFDMYKLSFTRNSTYERKGNIETPGCKN